MPKFSCEMVSFGECLGVFGGFGRPHEPIERELFIRSTRYTDGSGWTNEFHIYHLKLGVCSICDVSYDLTTLPCRYITLQLTIITS